MRYRLPNIEMLRHEVATLCYNLPIVCTYFSRGVNELVHLLQNIWLQVRIFKDELGLENPVSPIEQIQSMNISKNIHFGIVFPFFFFFNFEPLGYTSVKLFVLFLCNSGLNRNAVSPLPCSGIDESTSGQKPRLQYKYNVRN